ERKDLHTGRELQLQRQARTSSRRLCLAEQHRSRKRGDLERIRQEARTPAESALFQEVSENLRRDILRAREVSSQDREQTYV
ncbi:hypothetical protein LTR14_012190, partial [Exophiala xenobiotica]